MPGRDRTGPIGKGPMTGKCQGMCVVAHDPRDSYFGYGRRRAYRRGQCGYSRGFGGMNMVDQRTPTPETKKELLQERRDELQLRLEAIEKLLAE